jgi:hypothetical protein
MPHPEVPPPEPRDWAPLLDQELMGLPEKYRAAVVLCDLEGRPRKEAARLLRLSEGTLSSRLARARALLAGRLSRRGVALSGGALAAALAGGARAAVPAQLARSTAKVAALVAAGNAAGVGPHAAVLMHDVQRGMLMAKLKVCAALAAAAVLLGAGGFVYRAAGQDRRGPVKSAEVRPPDDMELLRKEVELLKLQVELLQKQARAQAAELRELKSQGSRGAPVSVSRPAGALGPTATHPPAASAPGAAPLNLTPAAPAAPGPLPAPALAPADPSAAPAALPTTTPALGPGGAAPVAPALRPLAPGGVTGVTPDPVGEVEAALKALRQARDPESRRRATDALEKAVKKLRSHQPGKKGA